MNTVRKHLSAVKGGQLAAAAYPAKMLALMISDVPGDDPAMIGSGPTVGDASTPGDARAILAQYNINIPGSADAVLSDKRRVLTPDDPRLGHVENVIYAAPSQSLAAATEMAKAIGVETVVLGDALEGEARDVARDQANDALKRQAAMSPGDAPLLLLSGGELTVTRTGSGVGGPNAEYALALALALNGAPGIHAIACDTDGVDGAAEVAGAVICPETLDKSRALGGDAEKALADNDAHGVL